MASIEIINGALAYIDGALVIWPKVRRESAFSTFTTPIRFFSGVSQIVMIFWILVMSLPGVGLAIIFKLPVLEVTLIITLTVVMGWVVYVWKFYHRIQIVHGQNWQVMTSELEQVERFFLQGRHIADCGEHLCWEGGEPEELNLKELYRVLINTREKLRWLLEQNGTAASSTAC
jgi:hypothetical protein